MPITLTIYLVIVFLGVPGLIIWLLVRRAIKRGSIRVLSPDEVARQSQAAQPKPDEGWSLPPELNFPTPRPVRKTHLGLRLYRGLQMVLLVPIITCLIFDTAFALFYGGQLRPLGVAFHAFLNFLRAPYWQGWMLWPSAITCGLAGLVVFVGYPSRKKRDKLLRWGKPACAVVTGCRRPGFRTNERRSIWTLQYRDAAGNLVETNLISSSSKNATGRVLTILYDPDEPSQCITYPVWGYETGVPKDS